VKHAMAMKKMYFNGTIITTNPKQPFGGAVGIEGEKINMQNLFLKMFMNLLKI